MLLLRSFVDKTMDASLMSHNKGNAELRGRSLTDNDLMIDRILSSQRHMYDVTLNE